MRAVLDENGKLKKKPDSPSANDGAGAGLQRRRRRSDAGRLFGEHDAAAVSAERRRAGAGRRPRLRRSRAATSASRFRCRRRPRRTIGDTLSAKNVSWAWYARRMESRARGRPASARGKAQRHLHARRRKPELPAAPPAVQLLRPLCPGHTRIAPSTSRTARTSLRDIDTGNLPQVTFYKPVGILTQHPSYTDLISGDEHVDDLLNRLRRSPQWGKNAGRRHV